MGSNTKPVPTTAICVSLRRSLHVISVRLLSSRSLEPCAPSLLRSSISYENGIEAGCQRMSEKQHQLCISAALSMGQFQQLSLSKQIYSLDMSECEMLLC